ncbi:MAG: capsular biosynthesis protein [Bacteroidota bacterium]
MNKKILIIAFTDLKNDPRVYRQINHLKDSNTVSCLGLANPDIDSVDFIPTEKNKNKLHLLFAYCLLLVRLYELFYWNQKVIKNALRNLKSMDYDLIIANDIESLPFAQRIASKSKARIVFDAHEYSPKEHENKFVWRILFQNYNRYLLRKYTPNISLMFTVCQGLADEYKKEFNLDAKVLNNASEFINASPVFNTDAGRIRIIHHGGAISSRKIENMIEMMDYLDERFELDLMLVATKRTYLDFLKEKAKHNPRIQFIDPVPLKQIVPKTLSYDLGIYILEPNSFNNHFALPNKLFEFIQARLAIAIGPSPEMKRIVEEHKLGVVADDFSARSLAAKIQELTPEQINAFKRNSHEAAQTINSSYNMKILEKEIQAILS